MPNVNSPKKRVLFVEGEADEHFIIHLCTKQGVNQRWSTQPAGTWTNILEATGTFASTRGGIAVGVVIDADDNFNARWINVRTKLSSFGVTVPRNPNQGGTVIQQSKGFPRVGIWVMPDNASVGALEDFAISMIRRRNPIWPLARKYIEGIPNQDRRFDPSKTEWAKLYALLATGKKPPFIGLAIKNDELDSGTRECQSFIGWLNQLFS